MRNKHIHFINIAGSIMAPLAVEFKKQGYRVTGSDKAFYPPASTLLEENGIELIPGFKPDKFDRIGIPDLACLGGFLTEKNPEAVYLKEKGVEIIGLGQLLERFFIKENSVVVAGSAGKTTITAMVAWILETAGLDPTILVGGIMNNIGSGVKVGKSDWSVSEGDEFKAWHVSKDYNFERRSRIHSQKPKYVVLTGAEWDHYDLYPTEEDYLSNFRDFLKKIPEEGFLVANREGAGMESVLKGFKGHLIYYLPAGVKEDDGENEEPLYWAENIVYKGDVIEFEVWTKYKLDRDLIGNFSLPMIGEFNITNAVAAIAMADQLGVAQEQIWKALNGFEGVKRRQELRFSDNKIRIYDDYAHSPIKVKKMLEAMRKQYPKSQIIIIYQPGSKDKKAIAEYAKETFDFADHVILPHVSSVAKFSREFNKLLADYLAGNYELGDKIIYENDDSNVLQIIEDLIEKEKRKSIIIFAGQKGFRGMIEGVIRKLDS